MIAWISFTIFSGLSVACAGWIAVATGLLAAQKHLTLFAAWKILLVWRVAALNIVIPLPHAQAYPSYRLAEALAYVLSIPPPGWLIRHHWVGAINAASWQAFVTVGVNSAWACVGLVGLLAVGLFWYRRPRRIRARLTARTRQPRRKPPITIGGQQVPPRYWRNHIVISGATGAGKSNVLNELLTTIRGRGERAIVVDPGGEFMQHGLSECDVVLNPFDARTVRWDPVAELTTPTEALGLAHAIVPEGIGPNASWHHYARELLAGIVRQLMHRGGGKSSAQQVVHYVSYAPLRGENDSVEALLAGTPQQQLLSDQASGNIGDVMNIIRESIGWLAAVSAVPDTPERRFSLADWLQNGAGWLWLPLRQRDITAQAQLITALFPQIITQILDLPVDPGRRLWLVADELQALGRIDGLERGMTEVRQRGATFVLAYQNYAQLKKHYGPESAETVSAQPAVWAVMNPGSAETAERLSRQIGGRYETVQSYSRTDHAEGRRSRGESESEQWRPWRTSTELLALRTNEGVLWYRGDTRSITRPPRKIQAALPVRGRSLAKAYEKAPWLMAPGAPVVPAVDADHSDDVAPAEGTIGPRRGIGDL